jgi:uncharacterized protein (TIGR03382 family)
VPTNGKVTTFHVGETVHVMWQVTVGHAGYFRIALAENRADFKDPPFIDPTACSLDMAAVPTGAHDNVLMDGIDSQATMQDVTLPNKPCEKCTLQVIQVMKDHGPPNCIYYHCADIKITGADGTAGTGSAGSAGTGAAGTGAAGANSNGTAGKAATSTGGVSAGTAGSVGTTPPSGSGGTTSTGPTTGTRSGGAGTAAVAGTGVPATGTAGTADTTGTGSSTKSGCSVASHNSPAGSVAFLLLMVSALARRRRAA